MDEAKDALELALDGLSEKKKAWAKVGYIFANKPCAAARFKP